MLEFSITDEGYYRITESMLSFIDTKVKTVDYKPDLSEHRVNNEPWRKVDEPTLEWFNKYYRPKFDKAKTIKFEETS